MRSRAFLAVLLGVAASLSPVLAGDGDLDTSFSGDGLWTASSGGSYSFTRSGRDPEGNLVVFGTRLSGDQQYFHWQRILPTGPGALCSHLPVNASNLRLNGIAFDYQGRLVLGGSLEVGTADPVIVVMRYLYPDCTFDDSLDGNGVVYHSVPVPDTELSGVAGVETARWFVPPALFRNRIVLPITLEDASAQRNLHWLRLLEDGSIDTGFGGGDGEVTVRPERFGSHLARTNDARYAIGGTLDELGSQPFVLKIDRDGMLVPDFGVAGERLLQVPPAYENLLYFVTVGPDGRLALGGGTSYDTEDFAQQAYALVLTANGNLDGSFGGGDGWIVYRHSDRDETRFRHGAFQGDRKLVLAGSSYDSDVGDDDAFTVRLLANGGLDSTFGVAGLVDFSFDDVPVGEDLGQGVVVSGEGRLWIAGSTQVEVAPGDTDYRPFVARLQNRYIFADGFERGSTANW